MLQEIFSDTGRLTLPGSSPIELGIFLSCIVPWLAAGYVTFSRWPGWWSLMSWPCALGAIVTTIAIGLTQSRGPVVAAAAVFILAVFRAEWSGSCPVWSTRTIFGFLTGCLLGTILAVKAYHRLEPAQMAQDLSIRHRLAIWHSTIQMVFLRPIGGIGAGEGGYLYSQWFEPASLSYIYKGLFNTFFNVAVEFGIPLFVVYTLVSLGICLLPFWRPTSIAAVGFAFPAYQSFLAITLGSLTYTWFAFRPLAILWSIDCFILLSVMLRQPVRQAFLGLCGVCILIVLLGLAAARFLVSADRAGPIAVALTADHRIVLRKTTRDSGPRDRAMVLVDRSVLGPLYGKAIRDLFSASPQLAALTVADPRFALRPDWPDSADELVLIGDTMAFVAEKALTPSHRFLFLLPKYPPPPGLPVAHSRVWLSEVDEAGVNQNWRRAFAGRSDNVKFLGRSGQSAVPAEMLP